MAAGNCLWCREREAGDSRRIATACVDCNLALISECVAERDDPNGNHAFADDVLRARLAWLAKFHPKEYADVISRAKLEVPGFLQARGGGS